jgi:hypothetical protein
MVTRAAPKNRRCLENQQCEGSSRPSVRQLTDKRWLSASFFPLLFAASTRMKPRKSAKSQMNLRVLRGSPRRHAAPNLKCRRGGMSAYR